MQRWLSIVERCNSIHPVRLELTEEEKETIVRINEVVSLADDLHALWKDEIEESS